MEVNKELQWITSAVKELFQQLWYNGQQREKWVETAEGIIRKHFGEHGQGAQPWPPKCIYCNIDMMSPMTAQQSFCTSGPGHVHAAPPEQPEGQPEDRLDTKSLNDASIRVLNSILHAKGEPIRDDESDSAGLADREGQAPPSKCIRCTNCGHIEFNVDGNDPMGILLVCARCEEQKLIEPADPAQGQPERETATQTEHRRQQKILRRLP